MNKKKREKMSDEMMCDVISKAITTIVENSENADFKKEYFEILQVPSQNIDQLKQKLYDHFMGFIIQKKADSQKKNTNNEDLEFKPIFKNNIMKELDGFADWEDDIYE